MLSMSRAMRLALVVVTAVVLVALATYAWRIWYVRYLTDDYCSASQIRGMGYFAGLKYQRDVWSGRFSYFAIKGLLELIGPMTARLTPTILLALLGVAASWSLRRLLAIESRLVTFAAAAVFVFAVIDSSPSLANIGGTFFWETGALTYALPMVLFAVWLGLLACRGSLALCCVLSALAMLVAGGLSETSLAAQGAMTGGVLVAALLSRASKQAWIASAGIVGTLLALAIVASAPGNVVRATHQVAPLPWDAALARMFELAYRYIGAYVFVGGGAMLLAIALGIVVGMYAQRVSARIAWIAAAIALSAYLVSFLPAAWLMPAGPPERALDVPNFFFIVASFAAAVALGQKLHDARVVSVAALALCVVPIVSIVTNVETLPEVRQHAQRVDEMHRLLRAHRGEAMTIRAPWALRLRMLHEEPEYWSNRCVADYYGLQSLRVVR